MAPIILTVFNGNFITAIDTPTYRIDVLTEYCKDNETPVNWKSVLSLKPGFPSLPDQSGLDDIRLINQAGGRANNQCGLEFAIQNNTGYDVYKLRVYGIDYKDQGPNIDHLSPLQLVEVLFSGTSTVFTCPSGSLMQGWRLADPPRGLSFPYGCSTDPSLMVRLFSCQGTNNVGCGGNLSVDVPLNEYDSHMDRFYFDSFDVVARINVYSENLFEDVSPGQIDRKALSQYVETITEGYRSYIDCQPISNIPCEDNREFIMGVQCKKNNNDCASLEQKDSKNQCVYQDVLWSDAAIGTHPLCMTPWKDKIAKRCNIGSVTVRCPHNQCVLNQSESICDCCSTTGGCYSRVGSFVRSSIGGNWGCTGASQCTTNDSDFSMTCDRCRTFCANYSSGQSYGKPNTGIATLEVYMDLVNVTALEGSANLATTSSWRNDLFRGHSQALSSAILPRPFAEVCFSMSFFLNLITVFYKEMYGFISWENTELLGYPYFEGPDVIQDYLDSLFSLATQNQLQVAQDVPLWNDYVGNSSWWMSNGLVAMPKLLSDTEMEIPMPLAFFRDKLQPLTETNQNLLVSKMISSMVRDTSSPIKDASQFTQHTTQCLLSLHPVKEAELEALVIVSLLPTATTLQVQTKKLSEIVSGDFVLHIVLHATIQTWSPMLYAYVKLVSNPEFQYTQVIDQSMVPTMTDWQEKVCGEDTSSVACDVQYCRYSMAPDPYLFRKSSHVFDGLFVNQSDPVCVCLRTSYGPASSASYNNATAMCFSKECSAEARVELGLTDTTCEKQCAVVTEWVRASPGDPTVMKDPSKLDGEEFKALCGDSNLPNSRKLSVNALWLVGLFLVFFFGSFYFCYESFTRSKNKEKWITTSPQRHLYFAISMVVGSILSIFLGLWLYGNSVCQDKTPQCLSQITNTPIPSSFCRTTRFCDCSQDDDCSGAQLCDAGQCRSVDADPEPLPTRPFRVYDVLLVLVVITFASLCVFRLSIPRRSLYWGLSSGILVVVVALLCLCWFFA